ncbi:MAG: bifunctional tRNA (5-methylaminomethyl-2-thiouridine)(34)-methyltransferase MnmD/FAD-dependent 5-carboxymethylaminomethyl-2-thiouridine(34) oxidoreductase MnmC [Alteromonadaceae bacterium]|nr:bifunctional tRNA (5-methylaminomethyl-2-thiouridine)(34)-methyltransferase MnmD/FAD-dependent 5-carboxymethylaminomethyl-2-thiouridine(34) oxidoreductase MnmC [Alteromonadaceae bacterium]
MTQSPKPPALEPAGLVWRDGVPESTRFGDVYFSRDNGLEETRYVFLQQNHLPERFAGLAAGQSFVIAETGFGTGLNFLAAWAEWLARRPAEDDGTLHFVSVERYPLSRLELEQALALWPELAPLAGELLEHYPPLIRGTHRLVLAGGRVRLTLYFGDVLDAWDDLTFTADAWLLDGFAPSLNPDMWLETAIDQLHRHSKTGTTLATFTAVGRVRRALADAGFTMEKVPGYGRKREMLVGRLGSVHTSQPPVDRQPVAILGAGIAGTALARNLAERGQPVILVDQAEQPGSAASGNLQGALYVKLGVEYNAQTELAATALAFSQRFYQRWKHQFWHPTGLLQVAGTEQEADRQRRFLARNQYPESFLQPVSPLQASELAGIDVPHSGLWFPGSGWLEPARACTLLANHPLIQTRFGFRVARIQAEQQQWRLSDGAGAEITASRLVIAAGHETSAVLSDDGELRLKPIRGQVSRLPESDYNLPETVICGTKYLNPALNGEAITGATFDLRDDNPEQTPESNQANLAELEELLPSVCKNGGKSPADLQGRVAFRCTTHDYQPVAGAFSPSDAPPNTDDSLFLLTGLGSKGLAWAPLLAEYLADWLTGQPHCLPNPLARRLAPQRLYRK